MKEVVMRKMERWLIVIIVLLMERNVQYVILRIVRVVMKDIGWMITNFV